MENTDTSFVHANRHSNLKGDRQEAQLLERDCVMLHVIEYFAKSVKVTQSHSK